MQEIIIKADQTEERRKIFWDLVSKKLDYLTSKSLGFTPEEISSIYIDLDIAATIESEYLFAVKNLIVSSWELLPHENLSYQQPFDYFVNYLRNSTTTFEFRTTKRFLNKYIPLMVKKTPKEYQNLLNEIKQEGDLGEFINLIWSSRNTKSIRHSWEYFIDSFKLRRKLYNSESFRV